MKIRLGIFDSGIGGFTVLRRVIERHGDISCVYLGDLARVPYGSKTPSEIRFIAREAIDWLINQNVSAVLVACNTTNSLALDIVEKISNVPVFGLIDAGAKMVFEQKVGVLATPTTVASKSYTKRILDFKPEALVLESACPAFVPMIETGQLSKSDIHDFAYQYLKPLLEFEIDSLILGCSHYPLIAPFLKELLPKRVRLIDPALGMAKNLDKLLGKRNSTLRTLPTFSNTRFFVTSDSSGFATRAMHWLNIYPEVEQISLRSEACVF